MVFDFGWAAGILEGEGCFALVRNSKAKGGKSAKIVVQMNDLDVLENLQAVFEGVGSIYHRPPRGRSKESWSWTVYKSTDVLWIIDNIKPWLGRRRAEKVVELERWIESQRR